MNKLTSALLIVVGSAMQMWAVGATAQVQMDDGGPCYSWQGGNYSAGAFTRCPQPWIVQAPVRAVAAPVPTPQIAPSPIMMPMTCAPAPRPHHRIVKKKPVPKC